jgi:hypothetical protein
MTIYNRLDQFLPAANIVRVAHPLGSSLGILSTGSTLSRMIGWSKMAKSCQDTREDLEDSPKTPGAKDMEPSGVEPETSTTLGESMLRLRATNCAIAPVDGFFKLVCLLNHHRFEHFLL